MSQADRAKPAPRLARLLTILLLATALLPLLVFASLLLLDRGLQPAEVVALVALVVACLLLAPAAAWLLERATLVPLEQRLLALDDPAARADADSGRLQRSPARVERLFRSRELVRLDARIASLGDELGQAREDVERLRTTLGQRVRESVSKLEAANAELSQLAASDALTGLANRRRLEAHLAACLEQSRANEAVHALLYIDLDRFKYVNDSCGHLAGDECLRKAGELLRQRVRGEDVVARIGGDEFCVLLTHCKLAEAQQVAESIREAMERLGFNWGTQRFTTTVSIGIAPVNRTSRSPSHILRAADAGCYAAKRDGRNRVYLFRPDHASESGRRRGEMQWATRLSRALERGDFELHLQPIVPVLGELPTHHEALLRFEQPDGTIVSAAEFLPAAERYEFMPRIDRWVVEEAFGLLATEPQLTQGGACVFINLSAQSISDRGLARDIIDAAHRCSVDPAKVVFEITESVAIECQAEARSLLGMLHGHGFLLALDDFGAGMSSLSYLRELPADFIKIDSTFVTSAHRSRIDRAIIEAVVRLGEQLGLSTVAEGVEDVRTADALRAAGVQYQQGYLHARPCPVRQLPLLKNRAALCDALSDA